MIAALMLSVVLAQSPQAAEPALPDDSLYLLDGRDIVFVDQHAKPRRLSLHRGQPVILAMFYATCPSVCPRLIADVQRALTQLDDDERRDVRVVLVSLDPARDTPAVLSKVIEMRGLDPARTSLLAGDDDDTRMLAASLGVKYRPDGKGAIDHSSRIVVLDRDGRIVNKRDGLGGNVNDVVGALHQAR